MVRIENNKLIIEVGEDEGLYSPVEKLETWKEAILRIVQRYENKDYTDNPIYWLMDMFEAMSLNLEQVQKGLLNSRESSDLPDNTKDKTGKQNVVNVRILS